MQVSDNLDDDASLRAEAGGRYDSTSTQSRGVEESGDEGGEDANDGRGEAGVPRTGGRIGALRIGIFLLADRVFLFDFGLVVRRPMSQVYRVDVH